MWTVGRGLPRRSGDSRDVERRGEPRPTEPSKSPRLIQWHTSVRAGAERARRGAVGRVPVCFGKLGERVDFHLCYLMLVSL